MAAKKQTTKHKDKDLTMAKYLERMAALPKEELLKLDGVWLTNFDLSSTISYQRLQKLDPLARKVFEASYTVQLMCLLNSMGIQVLGCTSERQHKMEYICPIRRQEDLTFVYVGKHNAFKQLKTSKFCLLARDVVYQKLESTTSSTATNQTEKTFVEFV